MMQKRNKGNREPFFFFGCLHLPTLLFFGECNQIFLSLRLALKHAGHCQFLVRIPPRQRVADLQQRHGALVVPDRDQRTALVHANRGEPCDA